MTFIAWFCMILYIASCIANIGDMVLKNTKLSYLLPILVFQALIASCLIYLVILL